MSAQSNSNSGGGIGFAGLLAILFIALKLTKVIAWSWWWVLAPVWASVAIAVPVWVIVGIYLWRTR